MQAGLHIIWVHRVPNGQVNWFANRGSPGLPVKQKESGRRERDRLLKASQASSTRFNKLVELYTVEDAELEVKGLLCEAEGQMHVERFVITVILNN